MNFYLGERAAEWNAIALVDRHACNIIKRIHRERIGCELMGQVTASELRVLVAIDARTLRFKKFAEAISLNEFCHGMRDEHGELRRDGSDRPYFAGCNISKSDTVSSAIQGLEAKGFVTRWPRPRTTYSTVYMPFSEDWLALTLAAEGGAVAPSYPTVRLREFWKITGDEWARLEQVDEGFVGFVPVDRFLKEIPSRSFRWSRAEFNDSDVERATADEIVARRSHR